MRKTNCWEAMQCGRQRGGVRTRSHGVCPAAVDTSCEGTNGGHNAGRVCWSVAGTLCSGVPSGTYAQKRLTCLNCPFFKLVSIEEGVRFQLHSIANDPSNA